MRAGGHCPFELLLPAEKRQCVQSRTDAVDGPAVSENTVVRIPPDAPLFPPRGLSSEPQTDPPPDAEDGPGGSGTGSEYLTAPAAAQNLSLLAARVAYQTPGSGLVR